MNLGLKFACFSYPQRNNCELAMKWMTMIASVGNCYNLSWPQPNSAYDFMGVQKLFTEARFAELYGKFPNESLIIPCKDVCLLGSKRILKAAMKPNTTHSCSGLRDENCVSFHDLNKS